MIYDTIDFLKLDDLRDRIEKIETFNDKHRKQYSISLMARLLGVTREETQQDQA
jgi:hypothetical protein